MLSNTRIQCIFHLRYTKNCCISLYFTFAISKSIGICQICLCIFLRNSISQRNKKGENKRQSLLGEGSRSRLDVHSVECNKINGLCVSVRRRGGTTIDKRWALVLITDELRLFQCMMTDVKTPNEMADISGTKYTTFTMHAYYNGGLDGVSLNESNYQEAHCQLAEH